MIDNVLAGLNWAAFTSPTFRFFAEHQPDSMVTSQRYEDVRAEEMILSEAVFIGEHIVKSSFTECDLTLTNFEDCYLRRVHFVGCDLEGASFEGMVGNFVSFQKCNLNGVSFSKASIEKLIISECTGTVDFSKASMPGAVLVLSSLIKSNFKGTKIGGARINACELDLVAISKKTVLTGAKIINSNIGNVPIKIAKGSKTTKLINNKIAPFLNFKKFKVPERSRAGTEFSGKKENNKVGGEGKSIYKNVKYDAVLYCSDMDEFRRMQ